MFDTAETAWEMEEARARLRGGGDGGGYGGGDDDERGWSASREVAREAAERDAMHAGDVDEDGDVDDGIVAEMTRLASLRAKAEREEEREAAAAKAREEAETAVEAARAAEEVRALRASVAAAAKLHAAKRWGVAKQLATDAVAARSEDARDAFRGVVAEASAAEKWRKAEARSSVISHRSPYDPVGVVNAVP